jgi:hypothetical protein
VDERNDQFLKECTGLLPRKSADHSAIRTVHAGGYAGQGIWCDAHVGIHEHQQRMVGAGREHVTGMLLTAPTARQCRRGLEPKPRVNPDEFANDRGGAIGRMIV